MVWRWHCMRDTPTTRERNITSWQYVISNWTYCIRIKGSRKYYLGLKVATVYHIVDSNILRLSFVDIRGIELWTRSAPNPTVSSRTCMKSSVLCKQSIWLSAVLMSRSWRPLSVFGVLKYALVMVMGKSSISQQGFLELLFGTVFEFGNPVLVRNLIHIDIEQHRGNPAVVTATTIIFKSIHEMDHCFYSSRIVLFELYSIFWRFLAALVEPREKSLLSSFYYIVERSTLTVRRSITCVLWILGPQYVW